MLHKMCSNGPNLTTPQETGQKSAPPDRPCFETRIRSVNEQLNRVQNQLKNYWNDERKTLAAELRNELARHKHELSGNKRLNDELSRQVEECKERVRNKQREVHEMEMDPDLTYRDLPQAKAKLALVEERYQQHKFSSIREEKQMVSEVDRLKRNVHRLGKYLPLVDQLNAIKEEVAQLRERAREVRMRMRQHVDVVHTTKQRIKTELTQPFLRLKDLHHDLRVEHRNLIEGYNDEREEYTQWLKSNKPPKNTFPTSNPVDSALQGDPLELFNTQKTACRRLITYLEKLVSSMPTANSSHLPGDVQVSTSISLAMHSASDACGVLANEAEDGETSSDSAEDLPSSFQQIGMYRPSSPRAQQGKATASKGRSVTKRATKKQAMPLSHDISYFVLFQNLSIQPPKTLQDTQRVLENVRQLLEFYEEQTALPSPGSSFEEVLLADISLHSPIRSLFAPSESGYSGFSAGIGGSQVSSPRSSSACSLNMSGMNKSLEGQSGIANRPGSGSLNSNSHSSSNQ